MKENQKWHRISEKLKIPSNIEPSEHACSFFSRYDVVQRRENVTNGMGGNEVRRVWSRAFILIPFSEKFRHFDRRKKNK